MAEAIDAVAEGFRALSEGRAAVPLRESVPLPADGALLTMPAVSAGTPYYSVKVVAVTPAARGRGLPLVQASVILGDSATGSPLALIEGSSLTALRTGAAGGLAARLLARKAVRRAALFGAGAQARTQLPGLAAVRQIAEVRVVTRSGDHADTLVAWAAGQPELAGVAVRRATADEALDGADVVVTATSSPTPVVRGARLGEGTHVTAVGSYTSAMRELDEDALRGARVVVDQREAALREAGELAGLGPEDLVEIGEIVAGRAPGRRDDRERTVFKSVGNAVQDLFVAALAFERARARGIGEEVAWP